MIRFRKHLIEMIEAGLTHTTAKRAVIEGSVECLGGFSKIPPGDTPGWIIKATSRWKKVWYISVTLSKKRVFGLIINVIPQVPWEFWEGEESENELYCGDRPQLYRRLKRCRKG